METDTALRSTAPVRVKLRDGRVVHIRPMHASDAAAERQFLQELSPESRRARFLCTVRDIDDRLLDLLTRPAEGVRALVAVVPGRLGEPVDAIVGVSRYARDDHAPAAECAITVADAWQGIGLGTALFAALCEQARHDGIERLQSTDASGNERMREFARALGARGRADPEDASLVVYEFDLTRG